MDTYSGNIQSISRCSTFHEPSSACTIYETLEELPFLGTIINKASPRRTARCVAILFWVIYFVSRLLPSFLRRPLFAIVISLDNLCFLAACYFEHAFLQASYFLWDGSIRTPRTLRQHLTIQPPRRLSDIAARDVQGASDSRLGSVTVNISNHADEDVAGALRAAADTSEELINRFLLPVDAFVDAFVDAGRDDSELTWTSPENLKSRAITVNEQATTGKDSNGGEVDLMGFETTETRSPGTEASTMDKLYIEKREDGSKAIPEGVVIERSFHLSEDEGFASGKDANISSMVRAEGSHQKVLRAPRVKSMLEPLEAVGEVDARHGSINPYIKAAPLLIITPRPTLPRQRSWNGNDTAFPSRATFDDIPGLRRQSQSSVEAKRLVMISVDAVSRAHHHWLRPCAACAKRAAEEKPKKRQGKLIEEEMQGGGGNKSSDGVYKRTVHWVKRQEERIKQL